MWAFWACKAAAQTKSIYVEKNVAWYLAKCTIGILQKKCLNIKNKGLSTNYIVLVGGEEGFSHKVDLIFDEIMIS